VDAPAAADVAYTGTVTIRAGDGSPVKLSTGVGLLGHVVWGSCPITLSLHTSDGKLTTTETSCTDPQTQAVIRFRLAPLYFTASRVRGQIGSEAQVQIEGPSGGLVSIAGIERTSAPFSSSSVGGAVYGKSAAGIGVVGVNANGMFQIVARRQ
jgi:hypothetical protein